MVEWTTGVEYWIGIGRVQMLAVNNSKKSW